MAFAGFAAAQCAWLIALCSVAVQAQTLNLPATLTSGSYSGAPTITNCTSVSPPSGCSATTLANGAAVTISAGSQVVLGPGFDAAAGNTSTSLVISLGPPSNVSVTPSSGAGVSQPFTVTASSYNWGNTGIIEALINSALAEAGSCYVIYYQSGNLLYLLSNDGSAWMGGLTPGAAGSVSNSQCTLNSQNSSVSQSGANLSVTFGLTFLASFDGAQNVYMGAFDGAGQTSGWQQMGTWTAGAAVTVATNPAGLALTIDGVAYTGMQTFTWGAGSQHTIAAATQAPLGTMGPQYVFANWSDAQAATHTVTVPAAGAT